MQCNPIVVAGTLYAVTAANQVIALDAATGREKWCHVPAGPKANRTLRGLVYWDRSGDPRILFTVDDTLRSLDARSGKPTMSFGDNGRVSLKAGLGGQAEAKWVVSTTPGALYEDILVMPTRVTEEANAALGYIQAFDVKTGKVAWVFCTIPRPGEPGVETWGESAYRNINVGGANCWAGIAVDRIRGVVFVPTGSASPDFWGGNRPGTNRFANSLIALDARTGQRKWDFQLVHHDIWDRDLPAPPNLVTIRRDGRDIDAVAQVTKSGFVFLFDRDQGRPLFPVREVPVPASELEGEHAWPTQPVPEKPAPFARQTLTEDEINPLAPDRKELISRLKAARRGMFQPFGQYDSVLIPGFDGGAEWGGAAVDPEGILYVNANEMAWIARLKKPATNGELAKLSSGGRTYTTYCAACHGPERRGHPESGIPSLVDVKKRRPRAEIAGQITTGKGMMPGFPFLPPDELQVLVDFLSDSEKNESRGEFSMKPAEENSTRESREASSPFELDGYVKFIDRRGDPAITPPWGSLTAIDLNSGEQRWRIPLGNLSEGQSAGLEPTGCENYGGPVVTAGGLLFIAATKDSRFRAYDQKTGELLWETELPAAGFATPATYQVDGKQYVVIAAGGTKLGTKRGDSFVAFSLPDSR